MKVGNLINSIIGYYDIVENKYVKERALQGLIYKNSVAYFSKTKEVCYIPELFDKKYNYFDFLEIANGNEDIANYLFETVDWQCPESLMQEYCEFENC